MDKFVVLLSSPSSSRQNNTEKGTQRVQTPPGQRRLYRKPYFVSKLLLLDYHIWWRYLTSQPSCLKWKNFSMAVLILNFELDLSKVNRDIWRRCWTTLQNVMKIGLILFEKSLPPGHAKLLMNKRTKNQQTRPITIHPGGACLTNRIISSTHNTRTRLRIWFSCDKQHCINVFLIASVQCNKRQNVIVIY